MIRRSSGRDCWSRMRARTSESAISTSRRGWRRWNGKRPCSPARRRQVTFGPRSSPAPLMRAPPPPRCTGRRASTSSSIRISWQGTRSRPAAASGARSRRQSRPPTSGRGRRRWCCLRTPDGEGGARARARSGAGDPQKRGGMGARGRNRRHRRSRRRCGRTGGRGHGRAWSRGGSRPRSLPAWRRCGAFLEASGDLVRTGPTGTNVLDLVVALKMER